MAAAFTETFFTNLIAPLQEQEREMTDKANEIIEIKRNEGNEAYLWVHDSGDVILWPDEASSEDDDGANAVERWHVDADTVSALIDSDECDEVA